MEPIKLNKEVRKMGDSMYYINIPKVLVENDILELGKKYSVILNDSKV